MHDCMRILVITHGEERAGDERRKMRGAMLLDGHKGELREHRGK